jgi:hypothetical protein
MFNFPVDYSKIVMLDGATMPVAVYTFPKDVKGIIFSNTSGSDQYPLISFYKPSSKSGSIQAEAINTIMVKNGTILYLPIKPYQYTGPFGPASSGFQIYQLY